MVCPVRSRCIFPGRKAGATAAGAVGANEEQVHVSGHQTHQEGCGGEGQEAQEGYPAPRQREKEGNGDGG